MQNYILMTDSDSDLPYALKVQYDIPVVYMPYTLEGKEYFDDRRQKTTFDAADCRMRVYADRHQFVFGYTSG